MVTKTKIKLRTCDICGTKKKVAEFSMGKICNKCEENTSTLQESTDDEVQLVITTVKDNCTLQKDNYTSVDDLQKDNPTHNSSTIQSLHEKMDNLSQRFDRMEALMIGLMELVGKINYVMEMSKEKDEE